MFYAFAAGVVQHVGQDIIANSGPSPSNHPQTTLQGHDITVKNPSAVVVHSVDMTYSNKAVLYLYTVPGNNDSPNIIADLYRA